MLSIVNKSRQVLPVTVFKDGKNVIVHLSISGTGATCESEGYTSAIKNLQAQGMLRVSGEENSLPQAAGRKTAERVAQPEKTTQADTGSAK